MDEHSCYCTGDSDRDHPQEKEMQKGKMVSEEALQVEEEKWKAKEKRKDIPIWMQSFKEYQGEKTKLSSMSMYGKNYYNIVN